VLRVGALLVFVVLVGATCQGVATALERREFPRPGRMVDVGGHQLHIYCLGEGSPTVVLEAPAEGMSATWGWVQPAVARSTRVCSYDRAGLGWSDRSEVQDPAAVSGALHTLLIQAGETAPFIVAGHGLGAAFATLYASQFAGDTAALVLIDAPVDETGAPVRAMRGRVSRLSPWLARVGILRATRTLSRGTTGLPEPSAGALAAFLNRPDHLTEAASELSRWNEVATQAADVSLRPGLPVTRLTVAGGDRVAFLVTESQAAPVVSAILDAVAIVRQPR